MQNHHHDLDASTFKVMTEEYVNTLEVLTNLAYLAQMEADNADRVREYMSLSELTILAMAECIEHLWDGLPERQVTPFS